MRRQLMLGEGKEIIQPEVYEAVAETPTGELKTFFAGSEMAARHYISTKLLKRGWRWHLFRLTVKVHRELLKEGV
jgi:hypothetical protein